MGEMEEIYVPGELFFQKRLPKESNIYSHFSGFNFTFNINKKCKE